MEREEDEVAIITWRNLHVSVLDADRKENVILNNVSGYALPKCMLAIMGPSSSGKSTLLDALSGKVSSSVGVTGQILLNGHESELAYGAAAFGRQNTLLVPSLTVRETLVYAALLRLPSAMTYKKKVSRVDKLLDKLGLRDVQDTRVGTWFMPGISEGQKSLVAIGCELITNPGILFLDEPTSGLDSALQFILMRYLQELAEGNRTILSVMKDPPLEVLRSFQYLCLLGGKAGSVKYFGLMSEALHNYETHGPGCPATPGHPNHPDGDMGNTVDGGSIGGIMINKDLHPELDPLLIDRINAKLPEVLDRLWGTGVARFLSLQFNPDAPELEPEIAIYSTKGRVYSRRCERPDLFDQIYILTLRMFSVILRNLIHLWLRLTVLIILTTCILSSFCFGRSATGELVMPIYIRLQATAGFLATDEDLEVIVREILDSYYGQSTFVIAYVIASWPFIFSVTFISGYILAWYAAYGNHASSLIYLGGTCMISTLLELAALWWRMRKQFDLQRKRFQLSQYLTSRARIAANCSKSLFYSALGWLNKEV